MKLKDFYKNILVLSILVFGIAAGVLLMRSQVFFRLRAIGTKNIVIQTANIDSTSFSVSWATDEAQAGFVRWGETSTNLERIALSTDNTPREAYHVTLQNLKPQTNYYYMVAIDNEMYGDNNALPIRVTTGSKLDQRPPSNTIFGRVVDQHGSPKSNAIIYVEGNMLSPMSTITDRDGGWVISLSNARRANLTEFAHLLDNDLLTISVRPNIFMSENITLPLKHLKPSPEIKVDLMH